MIKFAVNNEFKVNFRVIDDLMKFADIIRQYEICGILIVGGGVPRNYSQQIFPFLEEFEKFRDKGMDMGYKYSVRIHTATEYDGGLSGCTTSESKSWGKYSLDSQNISVWCDATIALPLLITGLFEKLKNEKKI